MKGITYGHILNKIYGYTQEVKKSRFIIHLTGKTRRFYLVHFRKGYVKRQLKLRRGQCRQCARCCNLIFKCPLLSKEGLCLSYDKYRWAVCKVFPIDQRDIDDIAVCGGRCGYHFKGNDHNNA